MSTSQPSSNAPSASPLTSTETGLTALSIDGEHGTEHRYVRRSYPKGKPEKLLAGLQRLLSLRETAERSSQPGASKLRWSLSGSNDAIHLAFTLSGRELIDRFVETLKREADELNHHPHISHQDSDQQQHTSVVVVTCTTHTPHGLSLKDVKLADRVNDILNNLEQEMPNCVGLIDDDTTRPLTESLIRQNEEEARSARENPDSPCNTATR